ncbi:MAG TPA: DUF2062 domain-containing protein [Allosphingosinicella sp.]|jgi:hypothetical protein|uniref:DUF2062 domain-containing protein n=1 Tax=Allosphingosinicella sp. TaxID=2823234 RepID=UPI002F298434
MAEQTNRVGRWIARNSPSREDMAKNRWTRPFAIRSELWRFTRRSVPRGVAIGLLVGIFLMVPGLQIIGAALLSLPFRGNIPIAAAMTFLSNPATTPFILTASYFVGSWFGLGGTAALPGRGASAGDWLSWLFSDAAPALVSGLFIIAAASAVIGYAVTLVGWRLWQGRKWKRRALRDAAA